MERVYCSQQNPDEPMIGTADPVDVWVLLEYRPTWKARAVEQSDLSPAVRAWLDGSLAALAERGLKARAQFVRQPERESGELRLLVGVRQGLVQFGGEGYDWVCDIDLAAVVRRPDAYPRLTRPQYFVCTNGQRDLCCARFGLPVYAALRERVDERAWQITHLGGHRFAPNVLALPQGVVYGRVGPDDVAALLDAVENDRLAFPHVRGRAWYPPAVQAAEALCGVSGLEFLGLDGDDAAATVRFAGPGGEHAVRVRRAETPSEVLKSCGDERTAPVHPYRAD
ncbi:MAG TPA: sucrase ferredoxin [Pseudomonadales bacterium]